MGLELTDINEKNNPNTPEKQPNLSVSKTPSKPTRLQSVPHYDVRGFENMRKNGPNRQEPPEEQHDLKGQQEWQNIPSNNRSFFAANPFLTDALSGALAGVGTGCIVAPVEYTKVVIQATDPLLRAHVLKSPDTYRKMARSVLPFSGIFGGVCALEFSVNKRIDENYGHVAGVVASGLTGAAFLTPADHLMFRRERGQTVAEAYRALYEIRAAALWTGVSPMVVREIMFITSVMHLGPAIGQKIRGNEKKADPSKADYSNEIGRAIAGIPMTLLSQPFDSMARQMQMALHNNPEQKPTYAAVLAKVEAEFQQIAAQGQPRSWTKHPLLRGAIPRMGLATGGSVLAGGFFDAFRKTLVPAEEDRKKGPSR